MNRCQKCGCEEFVNTFKSCGALMGKCKNCNEAVVIESSQEWEDYCRNLNAPKPSTPTVTCPYCQSTDTKKISGTSRWISTGLFGLASSKVGKQWHCNKCKSDF